MVALMLLLFFMALLINECFQRYSLHNLTYSITIEPSLVEPGQEFSIHIQTENNKPFPVAFLRIDTKIPSAICLASALSSEDKTTLHRSNMSILPYQRVRRTYKAFSLQRGRHKIHDGEITAIDVLGFSTRSKSFIGHTEVITLPVPLPLDTLASLSGNPFTFDPLQLHNVHLILNAEAAKPFWKNPDHQSLDTAVSYMRSLIVQLETQKIHYAFSTNTLLNIPQLKHTISHPGLGYLHQQHILKILGTADCTLSSTFEEYLQTITPFVSDDQQPIIIMPHFYSSYLPILQEFAKKHPSTILILLHLPSFSIPEDIPNIFLPKEALL